MCLCIKAYIFYKHIYIFIIITIMCMDAFMHWSVPFYLSLSLHLPFLCPQVYLPFFYTYFFFSLICFAYVLIYVCMYACMHVCMYACMHVCTENSQVSFQKLSVKKKNIKCAQRESSHQFLNKKRVKLRKRESEGARVGNMREWERADERERGSAVKKMCWTHLRKFAWSIDFKFFFSNRFKR